MRIPLVAGNWKMYTTASECADLCRALVKKLAGVSGVDHAVCPPFVHLERAKAALEGSAIAVGAQNMHWDERGAFTGEVSPSMLQGVVRYVIIGHSERRQFFCETDETCNKKLASALAHQLTPIFCVGETRDEREGGHTNDVLGRQVRAGLDDVGWTADCVLAYEPVWAIGTGLAATAEQANETIGYIRTLIADAAGPAVSEGTRIQYGGSVKADNAAELFEQPEIDGALVGGASLDADAFAAIVRAAVGAAQP